MFETDEVNAFVGNKLSQQQPYMQRSGTAEHVPDALLPKYSYDDNQLEVESMYYGNAASRPNARMPITKRNGDGDEGVDIGNLLEEGPAGLNVLDDSVASGTTKSLLSSLIADFPSNSSGLFSSQSNRLIAASNEPRFDESLDKLDEVLTEDHLLSSIPAALAQSSISALNSSLQPGQSQQQPTQTQQMDHATLAMQQLYVSTGEDETGARQRTGSTGAPQHHHNNASQQPAGGLRGPNARGQQGQPAQGSYGELSMHMQQQQQPHGQPGGIPPSAGQPGVTDPYRGQQMNMMPQVQYIPVDSVGVPPGAVPGQQGAGAQPQGANNSMQHATYYVQQPVYLDHNGQPVYFRVGPNGQYQQELIYSTGPDGNPTEPVMGYMPYPGGPNPPLGNAPMPGQPQGYWPQGAVPQEQGGPVFVAPGGQSMDGSGMVRRVVYPNPQYPGMGMMGPGMPNGVPNGGPNRGGGYPMPPNMPGNMMGGGMRQQGDMDMMGMYHAGGQRDGRQMDRNNKDMRRDNRNEYRDMDKREYRNNDRDRNGGGGGRGGRNDAGYGRGNSSVNPMRDPLVDEFRSTYGKSRQWELVDLLGHVVAFCQDQHGSRFIQQRLEVCTEVDKQVIFDEIIPSAHSLMTDVFGNYVLQKLFEYGSPEQCETLALLLTGQAVQLSMQMYGCRVVQKALEYVSTQRLIALVSEFENPQVLLRCVHDSNGNHVIQKCIEVVSRVAKEASTSDLSEYLSSRIMFIINAFQGRVKELSSHPYGCRVVQRILEHCSNPQKTIILEELRKCCSELVQDCYGNYVIQFVMQHGWEADRAVLIKEVQAHLLDFSQHKFASNVVEKCLQYASKRDRDEMIWTIINVTFDLNNPVDAKTGHCVLESMVRDPYANYVVQKVIDVSDERQRAAIMRYVRENIVQLRRYTYGKHIIVRLEKITNEKF